MGTTKPVFILGYLQDKHGNWHKVTVPQDMKQKWEAAKT